MKLNMKVTMSMIRIVITVMMMMMLMMMMMMMMMMPQRGERSCRREGAQHVDGTRSENGDGSRRRW